MTFFDEHIPHTDYSEDDDEWGIVPELDSSEINPQAWRMFIEKNLPDKFEARYRFSEEEIPYYKISVTNSAHMDVNRLCQYHWYGSFPQFIQFRLSDPDERTYSMSDEEWFAIYTVYIELGLRFPILHFLKQVLAHYQIALTHLCPNSVKEIITFIAFCILKETEWHLDLFHYFL